MASLSELMDRMQSASPSRRVATSVNDIKARLEIYKENLPDFDLTPEHEAAMFAIFRDHANVFVTGGAGTGKCLGKGTPVMLADGATVTVETIKPGDELLGPDGKPRLVLSVARGVGPLYQIKCNKGDDFVCNDAHLLTVSHLKRNGGAWHEITAKDFSKLPDVKRRYYLGVRASVEFPELELPLDPYFAGLWIGDGTLRNSSIRITKPESQGYVHAAVCAQAEAYGLRGKRYNDDSDRCGESGMIGYERGEPTKPIPAALKRAMEELGWNGEAKTIPFRYMRASRSQRLELLAGLIDSDGHLTASCFEISTKYEHIAKSILWLARSLGFQATSRLKLSTIRSLGFSGMYHRVMISGHTETIPTRCIRKQAQPRRQVKSPLRFGMTSKFIGEGEYYGFEIDGDRRFLLGDFTVTHNTTFIRDIVIPELDHKGLNFAVTATTGIAGSHLSGKTIHSWAGIGLGPYFPPNGTPPQEREPDNLRKVYEETYQEWASSTKYGAAMRNGVTKRVKGTEVLIIDEISMMAGAGLLGYIDFFLKKLRDDERPFGGIQVIMIGDFFQLPPVEKGEPQTPDWAFLSEAWLNGKVKTVELTKVFRQADQVFAGFLNAVRKGEPTDPAYVRKFVRSLSPEEAMCASYLVPTNAKADKLNNMVLDMYPGPTVHIDAKFEIEPSFLTQWETVPKVKQQLAKEMRSKERLSLRIGVPVLFKVNDRSDRYVNGTKGFISRFLDVTMKEVPEGEVEMVEVRIPKQGDKEEQLILLQRTSTTRSPKEDADEWDNVMDETTGKMKSVRRWPVALQFPLIPATALTIHSSQGLSLDECVIDLHQSFASGHVYVAMSRLRTAAGLTLASENFEVLVDKHVLKFYNNLQK